MQDTNKMKVLLLDNYDSFTYNLVHYVEQFTENVTVLRNNELDSIEAAKNHDAIIISPGPGLPKEAGITLEIIETYASSKKILGVCLGHQAIAEVFGGKLVNMNKVLHGVADTTYVLDANDKLFHEIPRVFKTGHYHSWAVDLPTLPDSFKITAADEKAFVMAMRHKQYDISSVQFHPESILTEHGLKIIENWIKS